VLEYLDYAVVMLLVIIIVCVNVLT